MRRYGSHGDIGTVSILSRSLLFDLLSTQSIFLIWQSGTSHFPQMRNDILERRRLPVTFMTLHFDLPCELSPLPEEIAEEGPDQLEGGFNAHFAGGNLGAEVVEN